MKQTIAGLLKQKEHGKNQETALSSPVLPNIHGKAIGKDPKTDEPNPETAGIGNENPAGQEVFQNHRAPDQLEERNRLQEENFRIARKQQLPAKAKNANLFVHGGKKMLINHASRDLLGSKPLQTVKVLAATGTGKLRNTTGSGFKAQRPAPTSGKKQKHRPKIRI